jgi:hypothetical protein
MTDPNATGQAPLARNFRERLAEHVAGVAPPSNFEAMAEIIFRSGNAGPEPCDACKGEGSRRLNSAVIADYEKRVAKKLEECVLLRKALADIPPDQHEGSYEAKRLENRLRDTEKNARDLRYEFNRRSICRACRGSGFAPRSAGARGGRPDPMFSTIPCESCRGSNASRHGGRAHGTSCGSIYPSDSWFPAVCVKCKGASYLVPITARPTLKTSDVVENPKGVDNLPEHFPDTDFDAESDELEPVEQTPQGFLDGIREHDPMLAAAITCYLGAKGDECGEHFWGRRFALWPLTKHGRQLADESRAESVVKGGYEHALDLCRIERLAEIQADEGTPRRRALITLADGEARQLEAKVESAIVVAEAAA